MAGIEMHFCLFARVQAALEAIHTPRLFQVAQAVISPAATSIAANPVGRLHEGPIAHTGLICSQISGVMAASSCSAGFYARESDQKNFCIIKVLTRAC